MAYVLYKQAIIFRNEDFKDLSCCAGEQETTFIKKTLEYFCYTYWN